METMDDTMLCSVLSDFWRYGKCSIESKLAYSYVAPPGTNKISL